MPLPTPGDPPDPETGPGSLVSPALVGGYFTTGPSGRPPQQLLLLCPCVLFYFNTLVTLVEFEEQSAMIHIPEAFETEISLFHCFVGFCNALLIGLKQFIVKGCVLILEKLLVALIKLQR